MRAGRGGQRHQRRTTELGPNLPYVSCHTPPWYQEFILPNGPIILVQNLAGANFIAYNCINLAREYPIYCSFFEIHKFIFPKNVDSTMKVQTLSLVFFDISTHDQYYCQYEKYLYIVNGANGAFTTRNIRLCVAT